MKVEVTLLPKEVDTQIPEDSIEKQLDNFSNRILQSLKKNHKSVEDKIYTLPKDVNSSDVCSFYRENL